MGLFLGLLTVLCVVVVCLLLPPLLLLTYGLYTGIDAGDVPNGAVDVSGSPPFLVYAGAVVPTILLDGLEGNGVNVPLDGDGLNVGTLVLPPPPLLTLKGAAVLIGEGLYVGICGIKGITGGSGKLTTGSGGKTIDVTPALSPVSTAALLLPTIPAKGLIRKPPPPVTPVLPSLVEAILDATPMPPIATNPNTSISFLLIIFSYSPHHMLLTQSLQL